VYGRGGPKRRPRNSRYECRLDLFEAILRKAAIPRFLELLLKSIARGGTAATHREETVRSAALLSVIR
jgi:hypothetical protein